MRSNMDLGFLLQDKLYEMQAQIDFLTQRSNETMATLQDVNAGIDAIKAAAANEKAEVQSKLDAVSAQISDLAAQLAAGVTPEQLDGVVGDLNQAASDVSNIFTPESPAEEPAPEEPPVEGEAV